MSAAERGDVHVASVTFLLRAIKGDAKYSITLTTIAHPIKEKIAISISFVSFIMGLCAVENVACL